MTSSSALQPVPLDADRLHLRDLQARLQQRESELSALKIDLQELQSRYLRDIGGLYRELSELEAAVADVEIRLGLRPPPVEDDEPDAGKEEGGSSNAGACSNSSAPSDDLKRVFRELARNIHPDLALDEPARCRRHSLMAEANRAYAERDEDRLRLILSAWERSGDGILDEDPGSDRNRLQRTLARIDERLIAVEAEFADLRTSAIYRLKGKIDDARKQGWDLFAEMVLQVKGEISRAKARLVSLGRQRSSRPSQDATTGHPA